MKTSTIIYIVVGLLLLGGGGVAVYSMTRGLRNNNPGNIRKNSTKWQGLSVTQNDPDFFQFSSPEWGIRALMVTLNTYMTRYGLNTIRGIITRWAPPTENNTDAYISAVSSDTGLGPDDQLTVDDIPQVGQAIIKHENGVQPYSVDVISQALALV